MSLKVGVIGAGRWGKNHVRVYSELDCELVGIADINPESKKIADEFSVRFFRNYKDMLGEVDAVSVVVPTDLHYKVVMDCLDAGKHVIVEKPMTPKASLSMELIKKAKEKKLVLMVGYLFRFNAAVLELKKQLPGAGDIHYITTRFIHSNKPPRKDSGVILNFATHLVDILNFLTGREPDTVTCRKVNYLSKDREDCALMNLDYGDFPASLEVSWFHPHKKRDMWVIGSKEKIYVDFLEQVMVKYPIRVGKDSVVSEREVHVEIRKNEPLKDELKYFCGCASAGRQDGAEAEYMITKVCEACLKSAESGRPVRVGG